MQFTGTIEFISAPETITGKDDKTYQKQYLIISDGQGKYPNKLLIEAFNKPDEVARVTTGQTVTVNYNAKVTDYNGKHFGKLDLYKFEQVSEMAAPVQVEQQEPVQTESNQMPF